MIMESESRTIKQSFDLQEQTLENETTILTCLRLYTNLNSQLYQFESLLYQKSTHLPRQLFKHFRKVRELLETSFNMLESFVSFNPSFIDQKDKILQEQISLMEEQISAKKIKNLTQSDFQKDRSVTSTGFQDVKRSMQEQDSKKVQILKRQIQSLKNQLRRNDSQYEIQIKKYNNKYQQLQDQIQFYKEEMNKVNQYVEVIEKLEIQIRINREIKERDQQLIQNMARKLRNLQRQKSGRFTFLSPSNQKSYLSPSRVSSQVSPKTVYMTNRFE